MAIKYTIEKHTVAFPSKVLARDGGKYIHHIHITEDTDNGNFVARGAWEDIDLYTEAAATTFEGVVRAQAANGNYYVEVVDPGDALFVYMPAIIEEEYNNAFQMDENFFNAADTVVRGYELAVGDVLEISEKGFAAKPSIGATVALQAISGKTYAMQLA